MELIKGTVVCSKAGRDSGTFLAVVRADDEGVFVADGKNRPLENPKKKNAKHLAKTNILLTDDDMSTDSRLRKALKAVSGGENR